MGGQSATGVAFTRDPATGERVFFGEWLPNAQGEDVVAGIRTRSQSISPARGTPPDFHGRNHARDLSGALKISTSG